MDARNPSPPLMVEALKVVGCVPPFSSAGFRRHLQYPIKWAYSIESQIYRWDRWLWMDIYIYSYIIICIYIYIYMCHIHTYIDYNPVYMPVNMPLNPWKSRRGTR